MRRVGLLLPILATACASVAQPSTKTIRVEVPIPVRCALPIGPDPDYADDKEDLAAAPNLFAKVQLLLAGRAQRMAREIELKAAVAGCG